MSLINAITSWYLKKRAYQIEMFIKHPEETQLEVFHQLLSQLQFTAFGKDHRVKNVDSIRKFQESIPVRKYEDFYPWIDKVLKGKREVLWPGETKWFSKSSGTTSSKSKFIPVTKESLELCHFKGGKDMIAWYLNLYPESQLFAGKSLSIGGSHEINKAGKGSFYGDLSAVIIENLPMFFQFFRSPSKKVALMSEWEEKVQKMAEETIHDNIASVVGVPTWTLVLINKIFELTGKDDIVEVWPGLEAFFHGGVSFSPYRSEFKRLTRSREIRYFETYNASEGFFGLQYQPGSEDLLLMLDYGIFYEFIPLDQVDEPYPQAKTLDEVEIGKQYALVISTNGGLWRYMIGDTVVFTSKNPYLIRISGRTRHFINAFGEELVVENAEQAISIACEKSNASIANFTAAPIYFQDGNKGSHEWIIEFIQAPDDLEYFTSILDNSLKSINSDYEAKRYKDLALTLPTVHAVPEGTFYEWMRKRGKLGGQNKVPRLSNNREYIEDLLKDIRETS